MSITVSLYVENQVLYVNLNGELDHHTSDQLRSRLNTVMSESQIKHIVFNLKHLDFMDSSGIGIILGRYNQLKAINGSVMVIGMKPLVSKVFELSGLSKIIKVINDDSQLESVIRGLHNMNNEVHLQFPAKSINESFARLVIIGFVTPLDPSANELNEIKTIVSEGVTNAIIHGYEDNEEGIIDMKASIVGRRLKVVIQDFGKGIENIELAKQPLYTTKQEEERSGLGFMIMESFSDQFEVHSALGVGTTISFEKEFLPIDSSTK